MLWQIDSTHAQRALLFLIRGRFHLLKDASEQKRITDTTTAIQLKTGSHATEFIGLIGSM